MKKIFIYTFLYLTLLLTGGCSAYEVLPDNEVDRNDVTEASIEVYLSQLGGKSIPYVNRWIILDSSASSSDFKGFSAAIEAVSIDAPERKIYVEFPNLTTIPSAAIFGGASVDSSFASDALVSVSAPEALSIGANAFYGCGYLSEVSFPKVVAVGGYAFTMCSSLTEIDLPMAESLNSSIFNRCTSLESVNLPSAIKVGNYAFAYCSVLRSILLSTSEESQLDDFNDSIFYGLSTTDVDLTIGALNSKYVDDNYFVFSEESEDEEESKEFRFEFKSITLK